MRKTPGWKVGMIERRWEGIYSAVCHWKKSNSVRIVGEGERRVVTKGAAKDQLYEVSLQPKLENE